MVALLSSPKWMTPLTLHDSMVECPNWADIEHAVRELDGSISQEVYLHPERENPETWLCIGGGAGKYVITGCIDNKEFPTYVIERECSGSEQLTIGGQPGEFPDNWIVGIDVVLRVAKAFHMAGGFDCGISWSLPVAR